MLRASTRAALAAALGRSEQSPGWLHRELRPGPLAVEDEAVTGVLHGRLSEQDVARSKRSSRDTPGRGSTTSAGVPSQGPPAGAERRHVARLGARRQRTGSGAGEPPEDVHAMSRGPLAAAGGLYEADMVIDALSSAAAGEIGRCASGPGLRLLLGPGAPRARGRLPRRPVARLRPERARRSSGRRQNLPADRVLRQRRRPPLPLAEGARSTSPTRSRSGRTSAPPRAASGSPRCTACMRARRPPRDDHPRPHARSHYYAPTGAADRSSQCRGDHRRALPQRLVVRAGVRRRGRLGRRATPTGARRSSRPSGCLTQLCPRWRVLEFAPGATRTTRTCTCCSGFEQLRRDRRSAGC